jgi:uncharacterized protein YukE
MTRTTEPTSDTEPDAVEINALLAKLRLHHDSVQNKSWVSAEIAGDPPASLDTLGSTRKPLSALDSAGIGFLTPMISFIEEPLEQLRGNPDAVSSGSGEFDGAGRGATSVAEEYRSSAGTQTSEWSGQAAADYQQTGTELIDGILSIAETSLTQAKALMGAGEVVAQVVDTVTRLVTEAVGKIVPIMSEAIAAAPATFGQSIAAAIPQCVQIAVDYGGQIATKLAGLLSSGENLMKLVEGALGVLKIVKEVLSVIGEQSQGGSSTASQESTGQSTSGESSANGQLTASGELSRGGSSASGEVSADGELSASESSASGELSASAEGDLA